MSPVADIGGNTLDLASNVRDLLKWVHPSPYRVVKLFKDVPTPHQSVLLDTVEYEHKLPYDKRKRRMVVCTGQGVGKTKFEMWIEVWRTLRRAHNLTIHSAPTGRQCRDVFLAEVRQGLSRADPVIRPLLDVLHDRVVFLGQKAWSIQTVTSTDSTNTAGFHRDGLTAVIDEFGNVDPVIAETFKGTLSNEDSFFLGAGNPNDRNGPMYEVMYGPEASQWWRFRFSSTDSPIVDQTNVQRLIEEYGWESDYVRVRIRGLFARGNPNAIIDPDLLKEAISRWNRNEFQINFPLAGYQFDTQIGIDFAREGDHESCIVVRRGRRVVHVEHFSRVEPTQVTRRAFEIQEMLGVPDSDVIYVPDAIGLGGGVMGLFHEAEKNVHGFKSNRNSSRTDFHDKGTEAWWVLRELLKDPVGIEIPNNNLLRKQLEGRTYMVDDKSGKIRITPKNKETKANGLSPDRADALVLAFYDRVYAEGRISEARRVKVPVGLGATNGLGPDRVKQRRRAA